MKKEQQSSWTQLALSSGCPDFLFLTFSFSSIFHPASSCIAGLSFFSPPTFGWSLFFLCKLSKEAKTKETKTFFSASEAGESWQERCREEFFIISVETPHGNRNLHGSAMLQCEKWKSFERMEKLMGVRQPWTRDTWTMPAPSANCSPYHSKLFAFHFLSHGKRVETSLKESRRDLLIRTLKGMCDWAASVYITSIPTHQAHKRGLAEDSLLVFFDVFRKSSSEIDINLKWVWPFFAPCLAIYRR